MACRAPPRIPPVKAPAMTPTAGTAEERDVAVRNSGNAFFVASCFRDFGKEDRRNN
jgi:hypothetical protein